MTTSSKTILHLTADCEAGTIHLEPDVEATTIEELAEKRRKWLLSVNREFVDVELPEDDK